MALGEASVRVVPDTKGFGAQLKNDIDKSLKGVDESVKKTTKGIEDGFKKSSEESKKSVKGIGDEVRNVGKAIAAAFITRQVINFAKSSILAAEAADTARARIQQVATSMNLFGNEVTNVTDRLVEYATQTARQTGIDKNQILLTQAKLLTFKNLAMTADEMGGAFDRATQAAIDMGATGFGDAANNAVQLGKALQDPIKGITALSRSGITFTADQKELIKTLVETNRVAEAQDMILRAIEEQVGGTAVATANASDKMRVSYRELQEQIGAALLPAFTSLTEILKPLIAGFNALPADIRNVVTTIAISTAVTKSFGATLRNLGLSAGIASKAMGILNVAMIAYVLNAQQTAKEAARYEKALADVSKASDENARSALANVVATRVFTGASMDSTKILEDLAEASLGTADRMIELGIVQEVLGLTTDEARAIIDKQVGSLQQQQSDLERGAEVTDEYADATEGSNEQLGRGKELQDGMNKLLETATKRYDDAVQALDDYKKGLEDALDAARSSIDTGFRLVEAELDAKEAIEEAIKATKNKKLSAEEMDKAVRDAAKSILSVSDAALADAKAKAKMSGATIDAAASQAIQIEALERFRDSLDPSSTLYQYVNGFIDTLEGIPTDIPIELLTEVDQAKAELEAFERTAKEMGLMIGSEITKGILSALAPLSPEFGKLLREMQFLEGQAKRLRDLAVLPTVKNPTSLTDISPFLSFADGGIFDRPQVGLFAEAGAEAIIPLTRPARALELMRESGLLGLAQQSSGTGQNFDITVVSAEPMRTAKDVVREFQALEYRMGPL